MSCILVENGTKGFIAETMHNKMCWRSSNTGQLTFQDCRVPKENLLGKRGEGFHQMLKTLDGGRLSIGAMGLGGAQRAFELALDYSKKTQTVSAGQSGHSRSTRSSSRTWPRR